MRVPLLFAALALCYMATSATAGSTWFQLEPGNINNQALSFKIKTEKTPQGGVLFYVDIESKKTVLSRNLAATLTVTSHKKEIARADIKEKEYGKGVRFVFEVSPKHLA